MNRQRGKQVKPLSPGKVAKVTKPGRYADGGGLYLWVKPDGRKTWTYRWRDRVTGGQREAGLGSLTNQRVTLKQARDRADKYRDMVWSGLDPIAERKRLLEVARAEQAKLWTFQQCAEAYIETNKAQWKNPKHTAQWTSTLTTYAAPIWTMLVRDIEQDEVLSCIEPHWTTKTETMTRVRQRIEAVLAWAKVKKYRTGDNPAQWKNHLDKVLPKPTQLKKVQHRPALPYLEAGVFMAKLRDVDSMAAKALELQILTATRPGETVGAQWNEFTLDNTTITMFDKDNKARVVKVPGLWTIPAERMKADKEHEIPLTPQALKLIKELPHVSDFLFSGVSLDKPMTTAAAMKLIKRIQPGITAHGFRSTFREWCANETAYPREVIEHALAHQLKDKAEASYQRSTVFPKRIKLMAAWSNYCDQIPGDSASVTPIRGMKP